MRRLPEATIREIAAGEVVERPASVVKELVENSLDAGATRIDVSVERGGKDAIRVSDDGAGMTPAEARLAVREHTTSKLDASEGLDAGVATLGFRGEALYAIGAVSTMTVTSRPRSGDEATRIQIDPGAVVDVSPAGRAPGTTVDVTELFAGMPARRKFLKADATEFDRVSRIVSRYALANPDVAFSLTHDGREVFATPGRGDRRAAIMAVYGREVAEAMIPISADSVTGFTSHPETTRSTREYVSTYVNGRYVSAGLLREAVVDAYGKQLAGDRYPFAVVFLEVPPADVDVNVHPRKLEVRFDDPAAVRNTVQDAVRSALLEAG
ncbi:MAG: DNA mismatch repair endonuclease MutL, partial [Halobacteriales archaeon]|nr:DNA mismatch repair endonuclease MutL [Halobacteriales archaeon]